ncbi:MAG: PPOX class F420-dependent oxidoreductase, partial [Gaiellales bacterium]
MSAFTDAELAYLQAQPLMRFASASPTGKPDVATVIFEADGDTIVTGGFDITSTVRYRNVAANPRVTTIVDDLASMDPWSPRGIKVLGSA